MSHVIQLNTISEKTSRPLTRATYEAETGGVPVIAQC